MVAAVALRGIFKRVEVAAAQRMVMSLRAQQGTCQPTCPQTGRFRGVQVHGKKSLEGVEKGRVD